MFWGLLGLSQFHRVQTQVSQCDRTAYAGKIQTAARGTDPGPPLGRANSPMKAAQAQALFGSRYGGALALHSEPESHRGWRGRQTVTDSEMLRVMTVGCHGGRRAAVAWLRARATAGGVRATENHHDCDSTMMPLPHSG